MAYEKSASGDRCLLQTDDQKVFATGCYEKIGLGNPPAEKRGPKF